MSTPSSGLPSVRGFRLPLGGQLTDLGYRRRLADGARDAGVRRPQRLRGRCAVRVPRWRAGPAAQEPGPRDRGARRRGAGQPDSCFARLLRPILAGGVPVALDGSPGARTTAERGRPGRRARRAPHWRQARARSWPFRTAATGTWPGSGSTNTYGPFATVAERLKPESLYNRFVEYRESLGFEVLPLNGGARPPFEILTERLRGNGLVCLMSDRDLTRSGVQVDFFGEPTRLPAGPAKLALETGAALLPVHSWYEPDVTAIRHPRAAGHLVGRRPRHHPGAGRPVRRRHRRAPRRLAHDAAAVARRSVRGAPARLAGGRRLAQWGRTGDRRRDLMRIGMVCPYSFDVPGGVQAHVLQLAEVMRGYGHHVSVLAPSSTHVTLPDYVVSGGKAVPIPYNGSVARLRFGPATHRKVKKWLLGRRLRRAAHPRAQCAEPVDARADDR